MWRGLTLTAVVVVLSACASTDNEGVACATSSLFVAGGAESLGAGDDSAGSDGLADGLAGAGGSVEFGSERFDGSEPTTRFSIDNAVVDLGLLPPLLAQGCEADSLLQPLDDGSDARRLAIADALYAARLVELAVRWYERADSLSGYQRLLALHGPGGSLADDAAYLRYEVRRAQLQQAFAQAVAWPSVAQAQPLYVQASRSALYQRPDMDTQVLEAFDFDERVYLIDVVLLEDGESYWVEAYYPPTLSLGWVPAEDLAQQPALVRDQFARLDTYQGRSYAQQVLFTALLQGMDMQSLQPLGERDFFSGADRQQENSIALLQRLGTVLERCQAEVDSLETSLAHYLMEEGPAPGTAMAPHTQALREALAALTQRPSPAVELSDAEATRMRLADDAYHYFRIRSLGQIEQRLCHSLPNAAGNPDLSNRTCEAVASLQQCLNRVDAIFDLLNAG